MLVLCAAQTEFVRGCGDFNDRLWPIVSVFAVLVTRNLKRQETTRCGLWTELTERQESSEERSFL
jgi:hypothetical protein